jgi:hypothetical protein
MLTIDWQELNEIGLVWKRNMLSIPHPSGNNMLTMGAVIGTLAVAGVLYAVTRKKR